MGEAFIRFENVEKIYGSGEGAVRALHDASFTIGKGEICVIVGPSGAGRESRTICEASSTFSSAVRFGIRL